LYYQEFDEATFRALLHWFIRTDLDQSSYLISDHGEAPNDIGEAEATPRSG